MHIHLDRINTCLGYHHPDDLCCCRRCKTCVFHIDTADSEGPVKYYLGLPVTYTALIFPVIYLFRLVLEDNIFLPVYTCGIVVVSVLEVLKVKMPKPRGIWYGIFGVFAIAMLAVFLVFV